MDRRYFLKNAVAASAGFAAMLWTQKSTNDGAILHMPKDVVHTNLIHMEKAIMAGKILTEENPKFLINLYEEVNQRYPISYETEKIKDEIREILISKSREFMKKTPSREKVEQISDEIDDKYRRIRQIKEDEKIKFTDFKGLLFVSSQNGLFKPGNHAFWEFNKLNEYVSLFDQLITNEEFGRRIRGLYSTLVHLSPDSLLIREASDISRIPIEEIVAFADLESNGKPFAIGKDGEVTAFQLNPKVLACNYRNALSGKNLLSDYILENTSEKTLLEDIVRNNQLGIAIAVNLMRYLKDETNTYYEYVLSYNRGLSNAQSLPQHVRKKLKNPEKISVKDRKKSTFRYYAGFLDLKKAFKQIRSYVTQDNGQNHDTMMYA